MPASPVQAGAPPETVQAWLNDPDSFTYAEETAFTITAYCPCEICCGKSDGITSTGVLAKPGQTIAVDPKVIPLGSIVHIEDLGEYVAEDIGGAIKGKRIDLFMEKHTQALQFGIQNKKVKILKAKI